MGSIGRTVSDFVKKNPSLLKLAPDIIKVIRDYKNLTFRFEDLVDKYGGMISDFITSQNVDAKQIAKELAGFITGYDKLDAAKLMDFAK